MARKLTERQRGFIEAYLVTRNAKRAALEAGYSPRWPETRGHRSWRCPISAPRSGRAGSIRRRARIRGRNAARRWCARSAKS
jgi:hypothetical protein